MHEMAREFAADYVGIATVVACTLVLISLIVGSAVVAMCPIWHARRR